MVSAIILIEVERGRIKETGQRLSEVDGITEVFSVGGRYDLVALIRVRNNEALADLVTETLAKEPGIIRTESLVSFKVFSQHDLDSMFSIGLK